MFLLVGFLLEEIRTVVRRSMLLVEAHVMYALRGVGMLSTVLFDQRALVGSIFEIRIIIAKQTQ